jgi:hypothetical protein
MGLPEADCQFLRLNRSEETYPDFGILPNGDDVSAVNGLQLFKVDE